MSGSGDVRMRERRGDALAGGDAAAAAALGAAAQERASPGAAAHGLDGLALCTPTAAMSGQHNGEWASQTGTAARFEKDSTHQVARAVLGTVATHGIAGSGQVQGPVRVTNRRLPRRPGGSGVKGLASDGSER
ncbi:unnamed protein product [Lampetra fluviatilis]